MIIIAGTMQFDPADRAAMLEAVGPIQAATRAEEPGCLAYAVSPDPLSAGGVCLFEHWADAASLEAHFRHPNFANAASTIGSFRPREMSLRKYHVDKAGDIFIDGRPSAAFPD